MPAPYFSEIKYLGAANVDFIEVAVDEGTDVSNIQVVVYNPNGSVRSTNSLGSLVNTEFSSDIYVIDTATSATFNGLNKNGAVALVDNGTVLSFVSFDRAVTATAGPANGLTSTQIGTTGAGDSLETNDDGATYTVQTNPNSGNIPCFLTGTMIRTDTGPRPVEQISIGDRVETLDAGLQPVLWAGFRDLSDGEYAKRDRLPVRIPKGALAKNIPSADLYVSPNHRMMLRHPSAALYFHSDEVLVPAKALNGHRGISTGPVRIPVRYHHLLLDRHYVIWANDAPSETLHLARMGLDGFDRLSQKRIRAAAGQPELFGPTTRLALTPVEGMLLAKAAGQDDLVTQLASAAKIVA